MAEQAPRVFEVFEGGRARQTARPGQAPPSDTAAEAAVLSAVLLDGEKLGLVRDLLTEEAFFSQRNAAIWKAIVGVANEGHEIDAVTVASWLRARNDLAAAGGAGYIAAIVDEVPAVVNVRDYASAVRRHWLVRRTIAEAQKIAYEGYAPVGDVEAWLAGVSRRVSEIVDDSVERPTTTADVGSTSAVSGICAASKRPGISGVRTWLKALDEATAGMHPRDLILLTAETGGGKTALAVTIGQNVASAGGGVLMFSLEMPQDQVYSRMLAREARVNWHRMRLGKSSAAEFGRVFDARKVIAPLPMLVEDRRNMTTQMMASIIRRERARLRRRGIELCVIIVDYIQKVYGQDLVPPRSTREREMARVAEELIRLAEREAIPLIALAQTNDDGLVRESRAILMEATAWWHIEGVRGDGTPGPRAARIEIKKQRHGPFPITAACWFHPEYVFFSDSDRPEWDAQMRASGEATEVENEQRREEQAPPATGRTHQEPLPTVSPTDVFNDDGP